jgi:hypothetical protein
MDLHLLCYPPAVENGVVLLQRDETFAASRSVGLAQLLDLTLVESKREAPVDQRLGCPVVSGTDLGALGGLYRLVGHLSRVRQAGIWKDRISTA